MTHYFTPLAVATLFVAGIGQSVHAGDAYCQPGHSHSAPPAIRPLPPSNVPPTFSGYNAGFECEYMRRQRGAIDPALMVGTTSNCPLCNSPTQARPDLLAQTLEQNAESLFDEVRYGMRDRPGVQDAVWEFARAVRRLRSSLAQGAATDHAQRDLQTVTQAFGLVGRELQQQGNTWSVSHFMTQIDRQLAELAQVVGMTIQDQNQPARPLLQQAPESGSAVPAPPASEPELLDPSSPSAEPEMFNADPSRPVNLPVELRQPSHFQR